MSNLRGINPAVDKYGDGYLPSEFVRPDNYDEELSPILDIDDEPLLPQQSGVDPNLPRFLFSPMRDLVTRHEICGYDVIFACSITMIRRVPYIGQNYEAARFADDTRVAKGVAETKIYERVAMYVAAGLIEEFGGIAGAGAPTGVVLLNSLFGLEPQYIYQGMRMGYAEDSRLLVDIQKRLLPYRPKTGNEQLKFLQSRIESIEQLPDDQYASQRLRKNDRLLNVREVYRSVLEEMIASTETALNYADLHIENVKFELNERALGHVGYKGRLNKVDRIVCDWAEQAYPEISGRLKQDEKTPQVIVQSAPPAPMDANQIASIAAAVVLALQQTGTIPAREQPVSPPTVEPAKDGDEQQADQATAPQGSDFTKNNPMAEQSKTSSPTTAAQELPRQGNQQNIRPGSNPRNQSRNNR